MTRTGRHGSALQVAHFARVLPLILCLIGLLQAWSGAFQVLSGGERLAQQSGQALALAYGQHLAVHRSSESGVQASRWRGADQAASGSEHGPGLAGDGWTSGADLPALPRSSSPWGMEPVVRLASSALARAPPSVAL